MNYQDISNPSLQSWVDVPQGSDFPIQNLPFGIFSKGNNASRVGVAIGEHVLDLAVLMEEGFFDELSLKDGSVFHESVLNPMIALGKDATRAIRGRVADILKSDNPELRDRTDLHKEALHLQKNCKMYLPLHIGDYTDFYSSIEHATNVGTMFRDPKNALLPNWKHLPVGYHGRASSIVISGTPIIRPLGQTKDAEQELPVFGPSKRLDFELEMAFVVGKNTSMGQRVSTQEAENYIFGFALFNDWSARDIQTWEYVPLGPFLAKNFASSLSPWIVTLDALEPFRVATPVQEPAVLPYLQFEGLKNFDIQLEVYLQPEGSSETKICSSNFKYMYWNVNQQLAHHTVNGCNIKIGDLMASGTISGPTPDSYGSMLELAWKGTKPLKMADGSERRFINDGDTVIMRGFAQKGTMRIGFGEVSGKVLPAN
ncbi:fumarylacetoacetase [Cytophagales bacterium LB-30]|uniref:fumarylacetoacetase n=1 Tax=Shiella aurantiaca TaxID=3058365 RepID=A0ABT8F1P1_9BACT|nr:fumarylacetoacetase [Shiella aurantiaca]MDN4164303.1 fumarylacetoacetase [Shiella aurantiaca]